MATKKTNIKTEKPVQKKEEKAVEAVPEVKKTPAGKTKYVKILRQFTNGGRTFFAGGFYPDCFFDNVEKLKSEGFIC